MENSKGAYSSTFYSLLAATFGGIALGGYFTFSYFKYQKSKKLNQNAELVKADIYKNSENKIPLPPLLKKHLQTLKLKLEANPNPDNLCEENLIQIISLIKEFSDFLFERRNKGHIAERRQLLCNIQSNNSISKNSNINNDIQQYEDCCSREYFHLYLFSLSNAKKYILKKINLKNKILEEHWEKYSDGDEAYYKINYYSNLFNNIETKQHSINSIKSVEFIKNLFEEYADKIIKDVANLENKLSNSKISHEERDEAYVNRLQIIKLRKSDELFNRYGIDDKLLKFLAVNVYKLPELDDKFKILLEKANGIDLISIGF